MTALPDSFLGLTDRSQGHGEHHVRNRHPSGRFLIFLTTSLWFAHAALPARAAEDACASEKGKLEPLVQAARHARSLAQILRKAREIGLETEGSLRHEGVFHETIYGAPRGTPSFVALFDMWPGGVWHGAFSGMTCETIDQLTDLLGFADADLQERTSHSWIWLRSDAVDERSVDASTDFDVMTRILDRHVVLITVGHDQ